MDIRLAISRIRPTSEYHWLGGDGTDYASIGEWRDAQTTKPTLEELQAAWDVYLAEQAAINAAAQVKATAETGAVTGYQTLPAFLKTMTADEAMTHIHSSVLSGKTEAQVNSDIDALANTVAGMKIGLKTIGASLVAIRDILELIVKLLLFIRDLVIRFRQ